MRNEYAEDFEEIVPYVHTHTHTPGPTTLTLPGVRRPLGQRWKSYLCPPSPKTVCPAFSPLFTRATTFTSGWRAIASTVLPWGEILKQSVP